ncbi:ADP-ribosyltransferase [Rickettsia endosymbiont of Urophora cardui]|uniref:ADP-ribosyltransferase n=1 Tax=Rickettsia endosymbiont of Urophora cardui TaxID=3066265 RepID=UPI00313B65F2
MNKYIDKVEKLLKENNLHKAFENVSKDKHMSYQYGPLNKSKDTQIFEEIIHDIIQDYENNTKNISFSKSNGQILLNRKGKTINLKNLLNNVNFNHLSISKEDIQKYATNTKINLSPPSYKEFQERIKEADIQQAASLSTLDYGEMLAIYKYTGVHYKTMSLLLRDTDAMKTNQIASAMLNTAIASHGLNKLPDIHLPQVIRNQDKYNLNQLIKNAQEHIISQEKGFISTSLAPNLKIDTESNKKNVRIIYKNVRGKSISAISQRPDELEYLLPPSTQIRWTGYKNTSAGYVFTAEGANVLLDEDISIKSQADSGIGSLIASRSDSITDLREGHNSLVSKILTAVSAKLDKWHKTTFLEDKKQVPKPIIIKEPSIESVPGVSHLAKLRIS